MTHPIDFRNLQRRPGWPDMLSVYLMERMDTPFAWGRHDCCLFAADWVRLVLGEDPAKGLRGKYRTRATGLALLKKHNGVRGLASVRFDRVPVNYAHRGDLVAFKDPDLRGPAWAVNSLGVLDGRLALFAGASGLTAVQRGKLLKTAWRVGR